MFPYPSIQTLAIAVAVPVPPHLPPKSDTLPPAKSTRSIDHPLPPLPPSTATQPISSSRRKAKIPAVLKKILKNRRQPYLAITAGKEKNQPSIPTCMTEGEEEEDAKVREAPD